LDEFRFKIINIHYRANVLKNPVIPKNIGGHRHRGNQVSEHKNQDQKIEG
jgi:hypothetical protein